ncbi:MAG: hypothetical protein KJ995_02295 [Candidatus Omnitrophica bacterium]|nr:hypothetical protein [Candidatus Omnitrophota bacterium]MBU1785213.1 hypothetical protein [Candidatus Omnitrophota bacterium]MBU1851221.1 hypothetical protein [Candidatus Omnitrophota bacterium]
MILKREDNIVVLKKRIEERLGEILLKQGAISKDQLKKGIEFQQTEGGLFGEILIQLGYAGEQEIAQAIVAQYGFPFMMVENYTLNPEAAKLVPENVVRQYRILPVDVIGDILIVVMPNPLNSSAIEDVEMLSGKKVQVFIGVITSINEAINKLYAKQNKD